MKDIKYLIQMGKINLFYRKNNFPKALIEVLKLNATCFFLTYNKRKLTLF